MEEKFKDLKRGIRNREIRQYMITFETLLHRSGCDIDNA